MSQVTRSNFIHRCRPLSFDDMQGTIVFNDLSLGKDVKMTCRANMFKEISSHRNNIIYVSGTCDHIDGEDHYSILDIDH